MKKREVKIEDLISGLHTGVNLVNLMELLTNKSVPFPITKKPAFRIQKIQNNSIAVEFAKSEKVNVVGCGAEDLVDGELKIILGFIWTLILKYQINKDSKASNGMRVSRLCAFYCYSRKQQRMSFVLTSLCVSTSISRKTEKGSSKR